MLKTAEKVFTLETTESGSHENQILINETLAVGMNQNMPSNSVISSILSVDHPVMLSDNTYTKFSQHLLRNIYVSISNEKGESFTLKNCKIEMSGRKYIGIILVFNKICFL